MNHPVTQPVSSLLSLLIDSRFEDRLVGKVKSVFASGTRYRESSQEWCSLFEQFDQRFSATRPATILGDHRVFLPWHTLSRLVSQSTWYRSWPGITDDDDFARTTLREQLPGLSSRDHTRTLPFHREIKARERAHSGEIPAGHSRAIT